MVVPSTLTEAIRSRRAALPSDRALLVAISGIDGAGKSTIARQLVPRLRQQGLHAVHITLDDWRTAPETRFSEHQPADHFYDHAYRFSELFSLLIDPFRASRSVTVTVEVIRPPGNDREHHSYDLRDVDVILLEGIFLLRQALRPAYDLTVWVDCSFETALERALRRNQEGRSERELLSDYRRIYVPAQEVHMARDNPRAHADLIVPNDLDCS